MGVDATGRKHVSPGPRQLAVGEGLITGNRSAAAGAACGAHNWWRSLERYAFPHIGRRPVSEVNTADLLEFLTPIWYVKAVTARAVHRRIRSVLERTIAMDPRNDNPCYRVLPVLGPQNDIVTHRLALPHKNVAAAVETVRASGPGSRHQAGVRVSPDHGGAVGGSQTRHVGRDQTADRV